MTGKDIRDHNRNAWDREVRRGNPCTIPVGSETIAAARRGDWGIKVTGSTPVPSAWLPDVRGARVMCVAGGGGQQGPILAAAGARVVVADLSPMQLTQDRLVAAREDLTLDTIVADMQDMSAFRDGRFDLIVAPVANQFVPDVRPIWREAFRLLRAGGILISGFINPIDYALDRDLYSQGILQLRHKLPYSDLTSIAEADRRDLFGVDAPIEFGHTLADQIGGQLNAGFTITGFLEDHRENDILSHYVATYYATRANKPPWTLA
jgi:2-polyprenyl-3-methyl-5-hydroxy-6-metoxy-1,4-benzoquinol methylase